MRGAQRVRKSGDRAAGAHGNSLAIPAHGQKPEPDMKRRSPSSTATPRPAGMQAMGPAIYEQIRQLVLESESRRPSPSAAEH